MPPLIAITTSREVGADQLHSHVAYAQQVAVCGGVPVLLSHEAGCIGALLERCDGFLLAGGDDPDTTAYGEPVHPQAKLIDPQRQRFEQQLIAALDHTGHPVLGVCLGMQMLALHHGGRLNQHLPDTLDAAVAAIHRRGDHPVRCPVAGHPHLPVEGLVRSHHHQAISDAGTMRVCGIGPGEVIEAVDLPGERFYLGVQWHPERTEQRAAGGRIIEQLVRACGKAGNQKSKKAGNEKE